MLSTQYYMCKPRGPGWRLLFRIWTDGTQCKLPAAELWNLRNFFHKEQQQKAVCSSRPLLLRIKSGSHHKMTFSLLETEIDSWTDWRLTIEMKNCFRFWVRHSSHVQNPAQNVASRIHSMLRRCPSLISASVFMRWKSINANLHRLSDIQTSWYYGTCRHDQPSGHVSHLTLTLRLFLLRWYRTVWHMTSQSPASRVGLFSVGLHASATQFPRVARHRRLCLRSVAANGKTRPLRRRGDRGRKPLRPRLAQCGESITLLESLF